MASGGITDPAFASAMSDLQQSHHIFQHPPPPSTLPSSSRLPGTSDLDSLSVLSAGTSGAVQHPGGVGGGARDNAAAISLSHVLSGLQEEGALAEVLQEQPSLAHGEYFVLWNLKMQTLFGPCPDKRGVLISG